MRKKETDLQVIKERYQKRLDRQNNYNKAKYDHISIILPAGSKETVIQACKDRGFKNPSEYFRELLKQDGVFLDSDSGSASDQEQNFSFSGFSDDGADSLPFG